MLEVIWSILNQSTRHGLRREAMSTWPVRRHGSYNGWSEPYTLHYPRHLRVQTILDNLKTEKHHRRTSWEAHTNMLHVVSKLRVQRYSIFDALTGCLAMNVLMVKDSNEHIWSPVFSSLSYSCS
jgi:hypothetical protein